MRLNKSVKALRLECEKTRKGYVMFVLAICFNVSKWGGICNLCCSASRHRPSSSHRSQTATKPRSLDMSRHHIFALIIQRGSCIKFRDSCPSSSIGRALNTYFCCELNWGTCPYRARSYTNGQRRGFVRFCNCNTVRSCDGLHILAVIAMIMEELFLNHLTCSQRRAFRHAAHL